MMWNIEGALAQIELVQARLAETQSALQKEIDLLKAELRRDQDPERMQLIQEMISVRSLPEVPFKVTHILFRTC
jgi:hypothetical protein